MSYHSAINFFITCNSIKPSIQRERIRSYKELVLLSRKNYKLLYWTTKKDHSNVLKNDNFIRHHNKIFIL